MAGSIYGKGLLLSLEDIDVGVQTQDKADREELYGENLRDRLARTEVYTALSTRHADKEMKKRISIDR